MSYLEETVINIIKNTQMLIFHSYVKLQEDESVASDFV